MREWQLIVSKGQAADFLVDLRIWMRGCSQSYVFVFCVFFFFAFLLPFVFEYVAESHDMMPIQNWPKIKTWLVSHLVHLLPPSGPLKNMCFYLVEANHWVVSTEFCKRLTNQFY